MTNEAKVLTAKITMIDDKLSMIVPNDIDLLEELDFKNDDIICFIKQDNHVTIRKVNPQTGEII